MTATNTQQLNAYKVRDCDIVAAYCPEGAIAVLCQKTGANPHGFSVSDVELIDDNHLDSLEIYDQEEGVSEKLGTSLRQDVAAMVQPCYIRSWDWYLIPQ